MTSTTLLDYLGSDNPRLDCTKCSKGANTVNARWDPVTDLEDWTDFNFETLMRSHGRVLQQHVSPIATTRASLTTLERQVFTERTFETVLERTIMPEVSTALRVVWPLCYSTNDPLDVAEIGKGDKARRGTAEEDDRYNPDWAGIRRNEMTNFGYRNLCPGETKLASKWSTSKEGRKRTDFLYPFNQIQTYCGRLWGSRYGYIITPRELVVIRVSRESVGPGLATSRSTRDITQPAGADRAHARTFSVDTVSSGLKEMSLDAGSSFKDDANPNIEYGPLAYRSIPWDASGSSVMTVKLALWWLHMETKKDLFIQQNYSSF